MGIKQLFQELGPGERVSLTRIAAQKLERTGIPFRLAIDYPIWSFQMESSVGGPNPVLRTLFFRLVRLMSLNIVPIFVFDGPKRPAFKRNKKTHTGPGRNDQLAKELIELFGFPTHDAPGEAEAECAFLQQQGIVDAVLTEDSDALMFGCGVTFRNWSNGKAGGPVTHINVYDLEAIKEVSGLTPAGMVLVALMSGADYIPEGIARCGIKTALEAARGGWGDRLAAIDPSDEAAIFEWREDLLWELKRNENKTFRTKHPGVHFKDDFPQREAWGFYQNPLVSCRSEADIERLKDSIYWNGGPNLQQLREYTRQYFKWSGKVAAERFIRVMAPAMLAWRLRRDSPADLVELINGIHGRREHASTDNVYELRLSAVPGQIVPIDLASEEFTTEGEVLNMDQNEVIDLEEEVPEADNKQKKNWEPFGLDRYWIPEIVVRYKLSGVVDEWDEAREAKEKKKAEAALKTKGRKKGADMEKEKVFMENYFLTKSKSASAMPPPKRKESNPLYSDEIPPSSQDYYSLSQKTFVGKSSKPVPNRTQGLQTSSQGTITGRSTKSTVSAVKAKPDPHKSLRDSTSKEATASQPSHNTNPWTTAKRNPLTMGISPPQRSRYSELGVYGSAADKASKSTAKNLFDVDKGTWSASNKLPAELEPQRPSSPELPDLPNAVNAKLDAGSHPPVTSDYFYDAYDPYEDYDEYYGPSTLAYDPEAEKVAAPEPVPLSTEKCNPRSKRESSFYGSDSMFEAIEILDQLEKMPPASTQLKSPPGSQKRSSGRRGSQTQDHRETRTTRRRSESPKPAEFDDDYWPVLSTQNIYRVDPNAPERVQKKTELTSIVLSSDDEDADTAPVKTVNRLLDFDRPSSSSAKYRPRSSLSSYTTAPSRAISERNSISSRATSPTPSKQLEREMTADYISRNGSDHEEVDSHKTPLPSLFSDPDDPRLGFITMTRGQHSASPKKRLPRRGLEEPATPTHAVNNRSRRTQSSVSEKSSDSASRERRSMIRSTASEEVYEATMPAHRQRRTMRSSASASTSANKTVEALETCNEMSDPSRDAGSSDDCVEVSTRRAVPTKRAEKPRNSKNSQITSFFTTSTKSIKSVTMTKGENSTKVETTKKNVRMRKSLKGHWAELDDAAVEELPHRMKRGILVGVDVVDLTAED